MGRKRGSLGVAKDAVRILEAKGYEAMNEFLRAVDEDREPPEEYAEHVRPCFVYLAFFGSGGESQYLKVGITDDISARMRQYRTACPLKREALLAVMLPNRCEASALEGAILESFDGDRLHGEWVRVLSFFETVARAEKAANKHCGRQIEFMGL